MKQTNKNQILQFRNSVTRVARWHFAYVLALAGQIIIYDAWKLITPEVVLQRWLVAAGLLAVTAVVWFLAKSKAMAANAYRNLVFVLIAADILVASFLVYSQRGMASRAVILYVIPIITAAVLRSRSAIVATAALCVAAYTSTALGYFVLNFNEGYKIELYGEVGFYSIGLFIVAFLLWAAIRPARKTPATKA